jgi:hypothetical protein
MSVFRRWLEPTPTPTPTPVCNTPIGVCWGYKHEWGCFLQGRSCLCPRVIWLGGCWFHAQAKSYHLFGGEKRGTRYPPRSEVHGPGDPTPSPLPQLPRRNADNAPTEARRSTEKTAGNAGDASEKQRRDSTETDRQNYDEPARGPSNNARAAPTATNPP